MSQQEVSDKQAAEQFLEVYQMHRYQNQLGFYARRVREYTNAQRQAVWLSTGLFLLTALAGIFEDLATSWVKTTLLLVAAICPILSTALAGYTALHGFAQQAKLYHDARRNLISIPMPKIRPGQSQHDPGREISEYVHKVEDVLQAEHGFWGQLADGMAPPGV